MLLIETQRTVVALPDVERQVVAAELLSSLKSLFEQRVADALVPALFVNAQVVDIELLVRAACGVNGVVDENAENLSEHLVVFVRRNKSYAVLVG